MNKPIKILIMGLPGSGKTFLAKRFSKIINADWLNADRIRGKYNDWDFTHDGIIRQVNRMRELAKKSKKKYVVADFVCPMNKQLEIFKPKIIIWMDTIKKGRFASMNRLFKAPKIWDIRIKEKNIEINLIKLQDKIKKYIWQVDKTSAIMTGRFKPWNSRHRNTFERGIKKNGQVLIFVKNTDGKLVSPTVFKKIKVNINKNLIDFKRRYKIIKMPTNNHI